jgi:hypothetical protein
LGTALILLLVRAFDGFGMMHEAHAKKGENVGLECFWAFRKVENEAIPTIPQEGQTEMWKALKPRVKAANVPKWAQRSQESIWESGGKVGDVAGKRMM